MPQHFKSSQRVEHIVLHGRANSRSIGPMIGKSVGPPKVALLANVGSPVRKTSCWLGVYQHWNFQSTQNILTQISGSPVHSLHWSLVGNLVAFYQLFISIGASMMRYLQLCSQHGPTEKYSTSKPPLTQKTKLCSQLYLCRLNNPCLSVDQQSSNGFQLSGLEFKTQVTHYRDFPLRIERVKAKMPIFDVISWVSWDFLHWPCAKSGWLSCQCV